jgi:hypothetical protein
VIRDTVTVTQNSQRLRGILVRFYNTFIIKNTLFTATALVRGVLTHFQLMTVTALIDCDFPVTDRDPVTAP